MPILVTSVEWDIELTPDLANAIGLSGHDLRPPSIRHREAVAIDRMRVIFGTRTRYAETGDAMRLLDPVVVRQAELREEFTKARKRILTDFLKHDRLADTSFNEPPQHAIERSTQGRCRVEVILPGTLFNDFTARLEMALHQS